MLRKLNYNKDFWICKCRQDLAGVAGYVHPKTKNVCGKCSTGKEKRPDASFAEVHTLMIIRGKTNTTLPEKAD